MPEQLDTTPPPGHGRSRLTDQNASRAMWFALAQSRICVQMDGDVSSCWSDRPFIPEMPMWAYAVASEPPKSNGMMVNTSMLAPSAAAWLTSRVPQNVGPVVLVPNVMIVLIPGLFCLTIFRAPRIRSCTASFSNSSMFSMSMSMNFSPYALMTCWYAPASALALLQFGPSLLPDQPPKEISTSPPPDRIALIVCWSTPPVN